MINHRRYLMLLVGILILTCVGYLGTYGADFVYEDANATLFYSVQPMPIAPTRVRALTRISYRLDRWMGGGGPKAYHLTNEILHLVNGILVGQLALTWISPVGSLLAMAIFLWHPLQTEAVSYIAGRTELLSTGLILLACLVGVKGNRLSGGRGLVMGLLLLLAMSAKESAVCGVGLVGLCLIQKYGLDYFYQFVSAYWRRGLWLVVPAVGLCVSVYWYEYRPIGHSPLGHWHYAALQATALWNYISMIPYPWGQTVDHDFEIIPVWFQGIALAGLFCWYCLVWLVTLIGPSLYPEETDTISVVGLCANWILISVILRFVVRIPETLNEHQIYLMWVGVSVGIVTCISRFDRRLVLDHADSRVDLDFDLGY